MLILKERTNSPNRWHLITEFVDDENGIDQICASADKLSCVMDAILSDDDKIRSIGFMFLEKLSVLIDIHFEEHHFLKMVRVLKHKDRSMGPEDHYLIFLKRSVEQGDLKTLRMIAKCMKDLDSISHDPLALDILLLMVERIHNMEEDDLIQWLKKSISKDLVDALMMNIQHKAERTRVCCAMVIIRCLQYSADASHFFENYEEFITVNYLKSEKVTIYQSYMVCSLVLSWSFQKDPVWTDGLEQVIKLTISNLFLSLQEIMNPGTRLNLINVCLIAGRIRPKCIMNIEFHDMLMTMLGIEEGEVTNDLWRSIPMFHTECIIYLFGKGSGFSVLGENLGCNDPYLAVKFSSLAHVAGVCGHEATLEKFPFGDIVENWDFEDAFTQLFALKMVYATLDSCSDDTMSFKSMCQKWILHGLLEILVNSCASTDNIRLQIESLILLNSIAKVDKTIYTWLNQWIPLESFLRLLTIQDHDESTKESEGEFTFKYCETSFLDWSNPEKNPVEDSDFSQDLSQNQMRPI